MLTGVTSELPPPAEDPARVRDLAKGILARPEFQPRRRSLLDAAWHWVTTELGKLLDKIFGGGGLGSSAASVIVVAVVAAAVIAVVLLTVRHRGAGRRGGMGPGVSITRADRSRSPASWRAEAAQHEAAGRWRDALRCRYRALLAELAGRGVVEERPGRTTGEYRQEVAVSAPVAGEPFSQATDLFEQAFYGDRPTGQADQAGFDDLARRVLVPVGATAESWDVRPPR